MISHAATKKSEQYNRKLVAINLADYEAQLKSGKAQRNAAEALGIPRGTLNEWKDRKDKIPYAKSVIDCLESPDGMEFLHRLMIALQLVMTEVGACGIRLVTMILELTGIHHFVGSSYESLRQRGVLLENTILEFGKSEQERLAKNMPHKKITIGEDETFDPKICLVGIEPVSNFILVEKHSDKRDAASWNKATDQALQGLDVEVIQSVSDEAKAIINHAEQHMGAHHSPDLFHVQQEISKATGPTLKSNRNKAVQAIEQAKTAMANQEKLEQIASDHATKKSCAKVQQLANEAQSHCKQCEAQQKEVKAAKESIGHSYHPYDIYSGTPQTADHLESSLKKDFSTIETIGKTLNLKETAMKKIAKAKKMIPQMIKTLVFYLAIINTMLKASSLSAPLDRAMRDILIPLQYLKQASKKAKGAKNKEKVRTAVDRLHKVLISLPAWNNLTEQEKDEMYYLATNCANVFQRSSSCVEGRNGYLSLRHHNFHCLGKRKLGVLTVIHNYFIKRHDQTTASERFFEQKPRDLFEYLLKKMPYPPRSGKRREDLRMVA